MMKDMNDWLFISTDLVQENRDHVKAQINKVLQDSLDLHVAETKNDIVSGNFGAVSNSNKDLFWLVKWTGPPHQLIAASFVEGGTIAMPVGTWVCEAQWYQPIPYAPGWYEIDMTTNSRHLYRLQLVATPKVSVELFNARTKKEPPATAKHEYNRATANGYSVKYIPGNEQNLIKRDIFRLEKLELLPFTCEENVYDVEVPDKEYDDHIDTEQNSEGSDLEEKSQQDNEPDESEDDETTDDEA